MVLPLFPLRTVLFPGMPLNLQIFEDRYLAMIKYMNENKDFRFAVHLIRKGAEVGDVLPVPAAVGCLATVEHAEQFPAGNRVRIRLQAIGSERIRLHALSVSEGGFYLAEIEPLSYLPYDPKEKKVLEQELLAVLRDFLTLPAVKNFKPDLELLASQGYALAYAMAGMFGISNHLKQKFLEENHIPEIYRMAIRILRGELRLIHQVDAGRSAKRMGPYSIN